MDRVKQSQVERIATAVKTPLTDAARFVITPKDVGSDAVRPGLMAELEHERYLLLCAARVALAHIKAGNIGIGAGYEFLLEAAVKVAEERK